MTPRTAIYFLLLLTLFKNTLRASEQDLLKTQDVHKIMEQMLSYHNNKKEMSQETLKNGLQNFAEQFDPYKAYLIESEINPLINPSQNTISADLAEYNANNYSMFLKLNKSIQSSIQRARQWRSKVEKDPANVLNDYLNNFVKNPNRFSYNSREYAKNIEDLEKRMQTTLMRFIDEQKRRYGENSLKNQASHIMESYEKYMRTFENQYLYQDEKGTLLPAAEQENLFSLHILKALASSLDAHSSFYNANEAHDMRVRLQKSFQGLGTMISSTKEGVIISGMIQGEAAEKSGLIKVNDIIIEIDGEPIAKHSFEEVMALLHNDKKNDVALLIKRAGLDTPIKVKLTKEEVDLNEDRASYRSEVFGNGIIGEIKLHSFYQNDNGISAAQDVENAIKELNKQGNLRGLILDLRENSGGFLTQAVKVAGLFITNGVIVVSKYASGEEKYYRDLDADIAFTGPLVILTSRITASAAEIVAQALQDYGVGIIVGDESTFGKGTIQTQTVTDNQSTSYFKVTVGKYYTVSGKTPQLHGVKADIVVPSRLNAEQIGEEYLEGTIKSDAKSDVIAPSFQDKLIDIQPLAKSWYLKYYTPSMQNQTSHWKNMLPKLRKNSAYRIENNKDYKLFLKKGLEEDEEDEEWPYVKKNAKDFGKNDLQMGEAVNIIKDMVQLDVINPQGQQQFEPANK